MHSRSPAYYNAIYKMYLNNISTVKTDINNTIDIE